MFSGRPQKNQSNARLYFDEHLCINDYYSEDQTAFGMWIGKGSERLGMKEGCIVKRDDFVALCDNTHPGSSEAGTLTQRRNPERRVMFDFTCNAPKSASIMAVTLNDQRIVEAHQAAARIGFKELEQFAATRIRKDGANDDRITGELTSAEFTHTVSRALDPHLHTHFTLQYCSFKHFYYPIVYLRH